MLALWGHLVYRRRWATLMLSLLVLAASLALLAQGGSLGKNGGTQSKWVESTTEGASSRAKTLKRPSATGCRVTS